MFKYKLPVTIILSSGSLILLAFGSLLFVGNTAYTSDIQGQPPQATNNESFLETTTSTAESMAEVARNMTANSARRRGGRLYNGQSSFGGQSQASMDSYAAAYAASNSPSSAEHSAGDLVQSQVQANEPGSYSSFGESPSSGGSVGSSNSVSGRQLVSSEYAPHSSFYSGYLSPGSSSQAYGNQLASGSSHHSHHYPHYQKSSLPMGYPTNGYDRHAAASSNYFDRSYLGTSAMPLWSGSPSSGGLMSSASTALSSWTSGFSVGEIICGLIALSIGAVILGAPFFLIYLALMGNFSGSGTLSLTNPTGTTTAPGGATAPAANGRRKRLAIFEQLSSASGLHQRQGQRPITDLSAFADSVISQLSPFVDFQQVTTTFKRLVDSIDKYSNMKPEQAASAKKTKKSS